MNTTELLAWAETPRAFDDMIYCGVDVTLATVKAAIRAAMQEAREEVEALALENHHLLHRSPLDPRECRGVRVFVQDSLIPSDVVKPEPGSVVVLEQDDGGYSTYEPGEAVPPPRAR